MKTRLLFFMGLEIVLYDASPVTQKIFSHILYHYKPNIHRIDQPNQLLEKVQHQKPDIIFLDQTTQQNSSIELNNQIKTKEEFNNIPLVLMSKTKLEDKNWPIEKTKAFLKKPIEAPELRQLIRDFVPKTKTNVIEKYLDFPQFAVSNKNDFIETDSKPTPANETNKQSNTHQHRPITPINLTSDESKVIRSTHSFSSPNDQATDNQERKITPATSKTKDSEAVTASKNNVKSTQENTTSQTKPILTPSNLESTKETVVTSFNERDSIEENTDSQTKPVFTPVNMESDKKSASSLQSQSTHLEKTHELKDKPPTENPSVPPLTVKMNRKTFFKQTQQTVTNSEKENSNNENNPTLPVEATNNLIKNQISKFLNTKGQELIQQTLEKETKRIIFSFMENKGQKLIQNITETEIKQIIPKLAKQLIQKELDRLLKIEDDKDES